MVSSSVPSPGAWRRRALRRLGTTCVLTFFLASCHTAAGDPAAPAKSMPAPSPPRSTAAEPPETPSATAARVDAVLREAWRSAGITPAERADDATFLRRVTIDITGTVPPPERVERFLADDRKDKRRRAVDELLSSPRYAAHMADLWDTLLMGPVVRAPVLDRGAFRRWLELQFTDNVPWNQMVTAMVAAQGQNSAGGARGVDAFVGGVERGRAEREAGINGATNWVLRYGRRPQDLAGTTSRVFLGVQIQCAQCHDHKTEAWTTSDFEGFTAAFAHTRAVPLDARDKGSIRRVTLEDIGYAPGIWFRDDELTRISERAPRALDGTPLGDERHRRTELAAWLTAPDNPWFARATVNRVWARMTGRGFVEPVDDLRPGNPPALPEALDLLAEDFVAHGYDLHHLVRVIASTEAYGLSVDAGAAPTPELRGALWSRRALVPMSAGVLLSALVDATGVEPVIERMAFADVEKLRLRMRQQLGFVFDNDVESNPDEVEATISQALFLLNGLLTNGGTNALEGGALATILQEHDDDAPRLRALYLRTLSREPEAPELTRWIAFLDAAERAPVHADPPARAGAERRGQRALARVAARSTASTARERAYEDVFWALVNSSEFYFNH